MKVPSLLSSSFFLPFLLGSVATTKTASAQVLIDGNPMNEYRLAEIEQRRRRHLATNQLSSNCEQVTVLLTSANIAAGDGTTAQNPESPKAFDRNGGVISLSDPNDPSTILGDYSYALTFLDDSFGCLANGAYTFLSDDNGTDQVTFTASCSGLPFFTITGGHGKYLGAEGFVEFMIPVEDGFLHEINICGREVLRTTKKSKNLPFVTIVVLDDTEKLFVEDKESIISFILCNIET